ncbi:hypothetical protein [Streptomyces sp. CBMA123]|uniref:hypothetical protein n=1 Tax=Streptomyces sp. CBMA123 TaxID=1896313 RepID=UPI001661D057|nr:hypothetical protein [Streptomyces sp. CBMA123]
MVARDLGDVLWLLAYGLDPWETATPCSPDRLPRPDQKRTTLPERFAPGRRRQLRSLGGSAERRRDGAPFDSHVQALSGFCHHAFVYGRGIETLLWRYARAGAALGITVLDRVVTGKRPLDQESLKRLCEDPTLAELEALLRIPVDRLLGARDAAALARANERRQRLLDGVEVACGILTDDMIEERIDRPKAAGSQLSVAAIEGCDAPWAALLDGVLTMATEMPYEIAFATRS